MGKEILGKDNRERISKKVALLGDSIFDNEPYVEPGEAVINKVNMLNGVGWSAELLAVDGAITKDVWNQCRQVADDTTHLIVSTGGNDALSCIGVFGKSVSTIDEAMQVFAILKEQFRKSYQEMLGELLLLKRNLTLCTIYDSCPGVESSLLSALSFFNDVIFTAAFKLGLPVIDFRQIFSHPNDYSSVSPIESSEIGGEKIAQVLKQVMESHDFSKGQSVVYC
jgi:hypothetical protein